jgi:hypothetical protein
MPRRKLRKKLVGTSNASFHILDVIHKSSHTSDAIRPKYQTKSTTKTQPAALSNEIGTYNKHIAKHKVLLVPAHVVIINVIAWSVIVCVPIRKIKWEKV